MKAGSSRLTELFWRPKAVRESFAPSGSVLYVVGDIHGCADLLERLLDRIAADIARHESGQACEVIFLGDYIDRGPDPRLVVDLVLMALIDRRLGRACALKGNHEAAMLRFLDDAHFWPAWAPYGARSTLLAYGVSPPVGRDVEAWAQARDRLEAAIPPAHMDFYRGLDLSAVRGDYFCAHAGARPDVPLGDQVEEDLLWIRADFLGAEHVFEKVIVHGHTPAPAFIGLHRIGVDTGAYMTGALSAIKLKGDEKTLIQVGGAAESFDQAAGDRPLEQTALKRNRLRADNLL